MSKKEPEELIPEEVQHKFDEFFHREVDLDIPQELLGPVIRLLIRTFNAGVKFGRERSTR